MKKKTSLHRWHILVVSALMVALAGCSSSRMVLTATPTVSPTAPILPTLSSPTPAPPYIHYVPSNIPNVHLEFDYPGSWYFNAEKMPYTDTIVIYLADPRVLTVPTRAPDEPHGVPSDVGNIEIWIDPIKLNQTLDSLIDEQKRINSTTRGLTLLNDYPIEIDGYDGYVLETLIDFPDLYTSVMFTRRIFFIAYDQVYTIDVAIAKQDRGGEFEQGYDYFFKSLKIVP